MTFLSKSLKWQPVSAKTKLAFGGCLSFLWLKTPVFLFLLFLEFLQPLSAQDKKIKIACIGNSITYGYTLPDPATQSYPALLQKKMGSGYEVKNFGHSGATLMRMGYNPYYKTRAFAEALAFHPDIAIICLGVNDTDPRTWPDYKDDFIPDYNWLIDTLRSVNAKMKIYVCSLMPVFTAHPRFMASTFTWYWEAQKKIRQVVKINHTGFIDLYSYFFNRPNLITDKWTLHPNKQGAERMCKVIYENITGNFGGLKVADIFTNNMVLQRDKPIHVWGVANAGTEVKVSFDHQIETTATPSDGKWVVTFPAMRASADPRMMTIENEERKIGYKNILIGDVWLCSGQSNMYYFMAGAKGGKEVAAKADPNENLRLFKYVPFAETNDLPWDSLDMAKADDLDFFHGIWKLNNEAAVDEFSAVGYWFGKKIQQEEHIPIGLIELAVGGSPLISWLDRITLEKDPLFEPALYGWRHSDYLMAWCRERADVNLRYAQSPFQRYSYEPCFNFEAGVAKITKFPIKGVIWYQGESDAENRELYSKLFPVFVKDWRSSWGYDFPLYYVQLPSIMRPSWNHFRNMQRKLLKVVPNSGMVITSDLGDSMNVHYPDKKPVGLRMADLVLHDTYGKEDIVPTGPLVTDAGKKRNEIEISFLYNKGLKTSDNKPLIGFKILNDKGYFVPVKAVVKDDKVFVEIPEGETIEKVVYGWNPFTRANLVNGAGLPASTFMIKVK
jgi:sialate O-acetylesterase